MPLEVVEVDQDLAHGAIDHIKDHFGQSVPEHLGTIADQG